MIRRWIATAGVVVVLLSACGGSSIEPAATEAPPNPGRSNSVATAPSTSPPAVTITPRPQPPSTEAARPPGDPVQTLLVGDIAFELFQEGAECLAVFISGGSIASLVERRCFNELNPLTETPTCGWLDTDGRSSDEVCPIGLPKVFFGQIASPDIGYVCIGSFGDTDVDAGVTGARFLDSSEDGLIFQLAAEGESARAAHLYGPNGNHYGDPPLDAPSGYIYERCDDLAPWGDTGLEYYVLIDVYFAEELRNDGVTVWFDAGLGTTGLSGGAYDTVPAEFDVRVPSTSRGLTIGLAIDDVAVLSRTTIQWPDELAALLAEGTPCDGTITVQLSMPATAADGATGGLELTFVSTECR